MHDLICEMLSAAIIGMIAAGGIYKLGARIWEMRIAELDAKRKETRNSLIPTGKPVGLRNNPK